MAANIQNLILIQILLPLCIMASKYPIITQRLHTPPLTELAQVFRSYLPTNFAEVEVEVVDCPDLSQPPFRLAGKGLGGNTKVFEVGGTQYLVPLPTKDKVYDLQELAQQVGLNPAFIVGAGAGPFPFIGVNCEGIVNLKVDNGKVDQQTRIAKVDGADEHIVVQVLPNNETRIALLGNLFGSEGQQGKVVKVHVKTRTGEKNFVETLRNAIEGHYGGTLVAVGGAFLIAQGKAKQHIMRDFSKSPLDNQEAVDSWLKFYEMSAPLVALGTFTSNDGGELDLRVQHFHSFSTHGEAGHYHYDTTADSVEYLGYFNVADQIVRVDKPEAGHKYGRD